MDDVDQIRIVFATAERAQSQVDAQLEAFDSLDLKALGVLAANVAVIGVLVSVHNSLTLWWVPTIALVIGVAFLLAVVWPTDTYSGPQWSAWYQEFGALSSLDAGRQMLADLVATIRLNERARSRNGVYFKCGFVATFAGLGTILVVALS